MQFHGFHFNPLVPESVTVVYELNHNQVGLNDANLIIVIAQQVEAVDYLHAKAEVLHNDITCRNIVLGNISEKKGVNY